MVITVTEKYWIKFLYVIGNSSVPLYLLQSVFITLSINRYSKRFLPLLWLREVILLSNQNIVGICKQVTVLILYQVSARLVTLLKFISQYKSLIFFLTVCFKLINIAFQIFLCFPESFNSFLSSDYFHLCGWDSATLLFSLLALILQF